MKLYDSNLITIDGKLDEPVWGNAMVATGLKELLSRGGAPEPVKTIFKILPCEDRVYLGIFCEEPDMSQDHLDAIKSRDSVWITDAVELFISPTGTDLEFYHIGFDMFGRYQCQYFTERGGIQPDPYRPDFHYAIHWGEDHWSAELELPLSMFYMTAQGQWSDTWLWNLCRAHLVRRDGVGRWSPVRYTWADMVNSFFEFDKLKPLSGFPIRAAEDAVCMKSAAVDITGKTENGYVGTMVVKTQNPQDAEFVFTSENGESKTVALKEGENIITVSCSFEKMGRYSEPLCLTRSSDGKVFKRYYPICVDYTPIRLQLTKPEYRSNFYPGQDTTAISGTVSAADAITLKLEGPGIETQIISPNADGSFSFQTPNFEIGDAYLTVTAGEHELVQRIRNLPPSDHTMSWISGGNLVINGKPTLRMDMYACGFHTGEKLMRKLHTDEWSMLTWANKAKGELDPRLIMKALNFHDDISQDARPCEEIFREIDRVIEANKDKDFVSYYLIDEPECHGFSPIYVQYLYDYIAEKDPYHVVSTASRNVAEFVNCYDWIEVHPYINPVVKDGKRSLGRAINTMGNYVRAISHFNRPDKCVGFLPTGYSTLYFNKFGVYPTFDEMICHVWAGMAAGGKTLWSFAAFDLDDRPCMYQSTHFLYSSFEALQKYILFAKRSDLLLNASVNAVRYDLNGEKMFVLVNLINEPQTVTVEGVEGEKWNTFRSEKKITGNTFELAPYEVIVATTDVMDAGMSTIEEVKALVERQEYARTHTGNKFLEKHFDIPITTTDSAGAVFKHFYKMFDGMYGNYAWEYIFKDTKFVELDLTKLRPSFRKVVVHGFQIDEMDMFVINGGVQAKPEIAEIRKDEWSTTFLLKEEISPEHLRFEFYRDKIEIYEIEAF